MSFFLPCNRDKGLEDFLVGFEGFLGGSEAFLEIFWDFFGRLGDLEDFGDIGEVVDWGIEVDCWWLLSLVYYYYESSLCEGICFD